MSDLIAAKSFGEALSILIALGRKHLATQYDPTAELRELLALAAGVDRSRLNTLDQSVFSEPVVDRYLALIAQRNDGVPMSHLRAYRDFYKHRFFVNRDVLDPRPETEILVETAMAQTFDRVLDLGTGSGCILLSLLAEVEAASGLGVDVSPDALKVAEQNRAALALQARAAFSSSDWYARVSERYDLIVSNPPYITALEMYGLEKGVVKHEPRIALTDEADGLTAYRKIISGAPAHLTPGGRLIVEIGPTQSQSVCAMFEDAGFARVNVTPDLDGRDRVVQGIWPTDVA